MAGKAILSLLLALMITLRSNRALGLATSESTASRRTIPVYFDSTNQLHRDLQYHPEQPQRIEACVDALLKERARMESESSSKFELIDIAPIPITNDAAPSSLNDEVFERANGVIRRQPFSQEQLDHALKILLQTHNEGLVSQLQDRSQRSQKERLDQGKGTLGHMGYIDADTYLTTESFNVCWRVTAAWIQALEDGSPYSFALTRPPGHHATKGTSNGFCLFNFAAAAAVHYLQANSEATVSILDWDVHYGQGVANILKDHPRSRYVSIHQTPAFPYLGGKRQLSGDTSNILTLPMPAETTWTCGYEALYTEALNFIVNDTWDPDVVIVCAGYDALDSDELASCSLQSADYRKMTDLLCQRLSDIPRFSGRTKARKLMLGLEGGYQLKPAGPSGNLPDAVVATVQALINNAKSSAKKEVQQG